MPRYLYAQNRLVVSGVYRLQGELLVVLDVDKVFELLIEVAQISSDRYFCRAPGKEFARRLRIGI